MPDDPDLARSGRKSWCEQAPADQDPGWIATRTGQPTVVRDILMGGDIEVHSRLGEGSVFAFEIELPVSEAPVRQVCTRARPAPGPREATNEEGTLIAPPVEEMSVLRELARSGDIRSILGRADYVRTLDPRYGAFAARLRALAEHYQSSAITTMIERYSNPPGPTDT